MLTPEFLDYFTEYVNWCIHVSLPVVQLLPSDPEDLPLYIFMAFLGSSFVGSSTHSRSNSTAGWMSAGVLEMVLPILSIAHPM